MEWKDPMDQAAQDCSYILATANRIYPTTTLIDRTGVKHEVRKFLWMGHHGFCDGSMTRILVEAKPHYEAADILIRPQVLIAGSSHTGWEIYSLSGELIDQLDPMSLAKASRFINREYPHI